MKTTTTMLALSGVLAAGLLVAAPGSMGAQTTPKVFFACYVPTSGTTYRIKEPGLRTTCNTNHVEFSWIDGLPGFDHGALSGLADDDHPQYLLTDGVRTATTGFAVTGTTGSGTIPATGPGTRLMWYPRKAAFRVGGVQADQWDDANVGSSSTAMGINTIASGGAATAMGSTTTASGSFSTAMGARTTASGENSTAMGISATASGRTSTAIGSLAIASGITSTAIGVNATASGNTSRAIGDVTTASGDHSTAIGRLASTNGMAGAFVYGDASPGGTVVEATAPNQFVVRASGGIRLFTSGNTGGFTFEGGSSPGCRIASGQATCSGMVESASGGFKFPDGTVQTTASGGGVTDHGALSGLTDDDHTQYLLADGVRASTNGFAVTGEFGSGTIPTTGPGVRLMWYPRKAAFRVGRSTGGGWDDALVGNHSTAMGISTSASGDGSTAMGGGATASGTNSTAMGGNTVASGSHSTAMGAHSVASGQNATAMGISEASGDESTAMGASTRASGRRSTAMGDNAVASGDWSTAIGSYASTNGREGSFVYSDRSLTFFVDATADNSFVVRAQRVWFGRSGNQVATAGRYIETSTGAYLSDAGVWSNVSDVNRKENFRHEDGAAVLERLSRLPIQSWSYKAEDSGTRHIGPTAQDFYAAFHLGDDDRTIGTLDEAGVALLAIQALERRTRAQATEIAALRAELAALRAGLAQRRE